MPEVTGVIAVKASRSSRRAAKISPIFWKMIVSAASGGAVYLVTSLASQPVEWAILLSVFVSGVVLVIGFLVEFDRNMQKVEAEMAVHKQDVNGIVRDGFLQVNVATELYSKIEVSPAAAAIKSVLHEATGLTTSLPAIAIDLAEAEFERLASFLRGLGEGQATCVGEDQEWLLALTRRAMRSIDAISTGHETLDPEFADSFWISDLGQRYLAAQREATGRGVAIRRLFILEPPSLAQDALFQKICHLQGEANVAVKMLGPDDLPEFLSARQTFDRVLFDGAVSYEVIPATRIDPNAKRRLANTQVITRTHYVQEMSILFEELWQRGYKVPE